MKRKNKESLEIIENYNLKIIAKKYLLKEIQFKK